MSWSRLSCLFFLRVLVFGLFLLRPGIGLATHIVGGEISYRCLGNNNYEITLKVYRDCYNGIPPFDDPGAIGIFDASNNFLDSAMVSPAPSDTIDPWLNSPCLIPPANVCVEATVYKTVVNLPPIPGGYQLSYQRCCRNHTINNILIPEHTGATYYTYINDTSVVDCNSSPYYNYYPPLFICVNETLYFDHSATDPDGDSLVYSICTPFDGADTINPMPQPPNAPPYGLVTFIAPYSSSNPLGGVPLSIDQQGILSGVPNTIGQFVVGVCVSEYRNGVYLGTNKRDFQFNVQSCLPKATVSVAPSITQCGNTTVQFLNNSVNAISYLWDFGVSGTTDDTSTLATPVFTYPAFGQYTATLIINKGYTCADTAYATISILPPAKADFAYTNQCASFNNVFTDLSVAVNSNIVDWKWDFGDGTSSTLINPTHAFPGNGSYNVKLVVTSNLGCTDSITKTVEIYPNPVPTFDTDLKSGCMPLTVTFAADDTTDKKAIYYWDFGDGEVGGGAVVTHTYQSPGTYNVSLQITSSQNCTASFVFSNMITVYPVPNASFTCIPSRVDILKPIVNLTNTSSGYEDAVWNFGDATTSGQRDPSHAYADTGTYLIALKVTNIYGCSDTAIFNLIVDPLFTFYIPNAFTPNGDGMNEIFYGYGLNISEYHLYIFDRWGNQAYETTDLYAGWDGKVRGSPAPEDVYEYLVILKDIFRKEHRYVGSVTLVR